MNDYSPNEMASLDFINKAIDPNSDFDIEKFAKLYKSIILNPHTFRDDPVMMMKETIKSLIYKHEQIAEKKGIEKGKKEMEDQIVKRLFK